MNSESQADFQNRAARLPNVETTTFETHLESLMDRAIGVVCMGGYNTFCEVLSFDKRALVVPRTEPRMEQHIRAERAQDLGLVRMLSDNGSRDAHLRSEEHTSELLSLMRISYAVFCLKKKMPTLKIRDK